MKEYVSEGRAMYEDQNHGLFSKRLAKYAIGNMQVKDGKELKPLKPHTIDEMDEVMKAADIEIPDRLTYTAWYLFNMAYADYPKTLTTDTQRAEFVKETLLDPDCCPEAVLECYVAKMCCMKEPIFWEKYL